MEHGIRFAVIYLRGCVHAVASMVDDLSNFRSCRRKITLSGTHCSLVSRSRHECRCFAAVYACLMQLALVNNDTAMNKVQMQLITS